ncbi:MAG: hypothetical protein AB7G93_10790 [Bdellovibrionales bacterium]
MQRLGVLLFCVSLFYQGLWAAQGDLKRIDRMATMSLSEVETQRASFTSRLPKDPVEFISARNGASSVVAELPTVENGVTLFKVVYETLDSHGNTVLASGVLIYPRELTSVEPLPALTNQPIVSHQHGTITNTASAPSSGVAPNLFEIFYFAARGYVVTGADYLGYGESTGFHPYLHADTEASASRDLLRAVLQAGSSSLSAWAGPLFLAGYSQGGHATMALHRLLENDPHHGFPVTASVPMAGPYNLSASAKPILQNPDPYISSAEIAYVVYAMDLVYDLFDGLNEVIQDQYASRLPSVFDSRHTFEQVLNEMPEHPLNLLQDEAIAALYAQDPSHPLIQALIENDVYDWTPEAPVKLIHGGGDRQVPFEVNSKFTYFTMTQNGGNVVDLIQVGELDHMDVPPYAYQEAAKWFDSFLTE